MVQVLKEPKNSLIKQYQTLMDMDGISLTFENDAIGMIAKIAKGRK